MSSVRQISSLAIVWMICRRELVRFLRQPARLAAGIGTPMLLWLLLASGFAESLGRETLGTSYASFLLPGIMSLVAVFAAIFSSISLIEDRREGWLQAALVSPAPRWAIALGRALSGTILAFAQAALLLLALPLLDMQPGAVNVLAALLGLLLLSFTMAGLGLTFAWRCETTSSFHAVMNLLFMPMWMLSGAFFPIAGAHAWLTPLIMLNPLTWATSAIRGPLLNEAASAWAPAMAVSAACGLGMFVLATWIMSQVRRA